jgi:glutamate carboxypeptidase
MNTKNRGSGMLREIVSYLEHRQRDALALLRRLVEIQSGSQNKAGLDRMAQAMVEVLSDVLPAVQMLVFEGQGNMVQSSTRRATAGEKGFLLVGHMDTVFPENTTFTAYREDSQYCYGPGVYDMKGGLVVGVYALKALHHLGLLDEMPVTFLCNSDEEIGSPASRPWIERKAQGCAAALVLEGGGVNQEVVTGRKGRLGLRLTVHGRAGHAAKGGSKSSAVLELAHKVIALEALNNDAEITLNVGQVEGGIGPNTVPDLASALIDVRFLTTAGQNKAVQKIETIVQDTCVSGTSSTVMVTGGRPAMPQSAANRRIFAEARRQAQALGQELHEELRSGVSDANFIAHQDVPVLDGLGPVGDLDHSDREYILKQSLCDRAALVAATMIGLWQNDARCRGAAQHEHTA